MEEFLQSENVVPRDANSIPERYSNAEYLSPTPGQISRIAGSPNLGSDSPEEGNQTGQVRVKLQNAYINCVQMIITVPKIVESIVGFWESDSNYRGDISTILCHSHLLSSQPVGSDSTYCEDFVRRYENTPGLAGWGFRTTPEYSELENPDGITKFNNLIYQTETKPLPVHVSVPIASKAKIPSGKTYEEYIKLFEKTMHPAMWSMEYYPVRLQADGSLDIEYRGFYNALEIFARLVRYTIRPFWSSVMCASRAYGSDKGHALPTEGRLRFAVFSALAYGAKGIFYSHFRSQSETDWYKSSPLDVDGNTTPVYDYLRVINADMAALDAILSAGEMIDVRHTGTMVFDEINYENPAYYRKMHTGWGPLLAPVQGETAGFLVSHIFSHDDDGGSDYLMIVNHDTENSQTLGLSLGSYYKMWEVVVSDVNAVETEIPGDVSYTWKVPAGSFKLFRWK